MKNNKKHLRKKIFVDREIQGALIRRLILQWLLFFTASLFALPMWEIMLNGDFQSPASVSIQNSLKHTAPVFIIMLALLPSFVWDTIKLSNRFAGPMLRLHRTIREAAEGEEVEPLDFRDGDFWQKVAQDFNKLLERIPQEDRTEPVDSGNEAEEAVLAGVK